jgi:hypothetical protein
MIVIKYVVIKSYYYDYIMPYSVLYHFDHKFTNSENLLAEMADEISFEF